MSVCYWLKSSDFAIPVDLVNIVPCFEEWDTRAMRAFASTVDGIRRAATSVANVHLGVPCARARLISHKPMRKR